MKTVFLVWILAFLLVFLALGGLYGGIAMLIDPTGKIMRMEEVLPLLPVSDYILPGLFLVLVMGLLPLLLTVGILRQPDWKLLNSLAKWSRHHWAWTGTLAVGIILIIWLTVQGFYIGFRWPIQYVTLINGIFIILVTVIPGIEKKFRR